MKQLSEQDTIRLLDAYGLPYAQTILCRTAIDIDLACKTLGFPLVMKIASEAVVHKSDCGGVIGGIRSVDDAKRAYDRILKNVKKAYGDVPIEGLMVSRFIDGHQLLIGAKRDAQFGPVVMFGTGGIYVEVFRDVAMRICPVSKTEARKMVKETKVWHILKGIRGQTPADINGVVDIIAKVSKLMMKEIFVKELDFNPVIVNGQESMIVDMRVMTE